jgi:N-acyl-D-amino-acid deacylase
MPAEKFKLEKRGQIAEGYHADLVIFNPETIADKSTMEEPYQYPVGISQVIVNGSVALDGDALSSKRFGQVLRRKKKSFLPW